MYKNQCVCVYLCVCVCVCRIGAHTVHPIAMKLSNVVANMLAVVLEIKNKNEIVLVGVPGVTLQEHTAFIRLR